MSCNARRRPRRPAGKPNPGGSQPQRAGGLLRRPLPGPPGSPAGAARARPGLRRRRLGRPVPLARAARAVDRRRHRAVARGRRAHPHRRRLRHLRRRAPPVRRPRASTSSTASRCSSTSATPSRCSPRSRACWRRTAGFAGSTSHLEAFHSRSVWNYTPYGLMLLLEEAGLELVEVRPVIDAFTLVAWRALGTPRFFYRWWARESPPYRAISLLARTAALGPPHRQHGQAHPERAVHVPGASGARRGIGSPRAPCRRPGRRRSRARRIRRRPRR